ncbi:MAG: hypothetical protein ABIR71_04225, partial [Chthoniobacterales bacterium]
MLGSLGRALGAAVVLASVVQAATAGQPASNRKMAERLAKLGKDYDQRVIAQRPDLHLARYLRHI